MAAGIYRIHNKINNKNYIGRSSNLENRQKQHWQEMENGAKNSVWNHDVEKYGLDSFEWIIEEIVADENDTLKMQYLEDYYIAKYKSFGANGYNSKRGDVNVISSASSMPFADIKDLENYTLETFYYNDYYDALVNVASAKEFFPPYIYPYEYAELIGVAFNIPPHKVYDNIPHSYYWWKNITKTHKDIDGGTTEESERILSKAELQKLVLNKSDTIYFTDPVYPKIIYDFYKAIFDKYEKFLHTIISHEDTYFDRPEDIMPVWMAKICSFGFNGIFKTSDYPQIKAAYFLFSRFSTYKDIEEIDFEVNQYYHYVREFLFSDTPLWEIGKEQLDQNYLEER